MEHAVKFRSPGLPTVHSVVVSAAMTRADLVDILNGLDGVVDPPKHMFTTFFINGYKVNDGDMSAIRSTAGPVHYIRGLYKTFTQFSPRKTHTLLLNPRSTHESITAKLDELDEVPSLSMEFLVRSKLTGLRGLPKNDVRAILDSDADVYYIRTFGRAVVFKDLHTSQHTLAVTNRMTQQDIVDFLNNADSIQGHADIAFFTSPLARIPQGSMSEFLDPGAGTVFRYVRKLAYPIKFWGPKEDRTLYVSELTSLEDIVAQLDRLDNAPLRKLRFTVDDAEVSRQGIQPGKVVRYSVRHHAAGGARRPRKSRTSRTSRKSKTSRRSRTRRHVRAR
jgi:hypothetical protein